MGHILHGVCTAHIGIVSSVQEAASWTLDGKRNPTFQAHELLAALQTTDDTGLAMELDRMEVVKGLHMNEMILSRTSSACLRCNYAVFFVWNS